MLSPVSHGFMGFKSCSETVLTRKIAGRPEGSRPEPGEPPHTKHALTIAFRLISLPRIRRGRVKFIRVGQIFCVLFKPMPFPTL